MKDKFNKRILVIDDDENIRDSFRDILLPLRRKDPSLSAASNRLFDDTPVALPMQSNGFEFTVDVACNGKEGFECVKKAIETGQPYSLLFVDMRMPGWDGLETVKNIRKIDKRAEIIFVTAYSDHSISEIVNEAGSNVGYHCKPFEVDEIRQLATKSVFDWNKARNLEALIGSISSLKTSQWNVDVLLHNILQQLADMLGTQSAMVLMKEEDQFRKVLSIGKFLSEEVSEPLLSSLPKTIDAEDPVHNGYVYFKLEPYGVIALLEEPEEKLRQEHYFLVTLFLEHACQTLENVELQQSLVRQESLSAIGQAVSMINHDMRNIVSAIIGCSDVLMDGISPENTEELIGVIKSSAQEGLALLEDMLAFTRGGEPNMSDNDSVEFMDKVSQRVKLMKQNFPGITFQIEPPVAASFKCDTTKIIRVIDNLMRNAAEAIKSSGMDDGRVTLELVFRGDSTVITVEDNGPGIPEIIRESLFTPFKTYGKDFGTGLGLAIVKQFVESHNGRIDFESTPGKTVFTLTI